ncbi:hypothetical protein GCM10010869_24640 [Mesorhizobium tianshanense]|nr:hypothetical protein GCM10010869_24640 [Mesorhizobium tianshanense]
MGELREDLAHQMWPEGRNQTGSGDNASSWLDAKQMDRVRSIKRIDLATVEASQLMPSAFVDVNLMSQAKVAVEMLSIGKAV